VTPALLAIANVRIADVAAFGRKPHFNQRRSAESPLRKKSPIGMNVKPLAISGSLNKYQRSEATNP
jgi:hypothetical protein